MSLQKRLSRSVVTFTALVVVALFTAPLNAQSTYDWTHADDREWETGASWDLLSSPGSLLNTGGAVDDIVNITRVAGDRLDLNADAGTVGSFSIGGGTGTMTLRMEGGGAGALTVSGLTTIGGLDGATNRDGRFELRRGQGATTLNLLGQVVSGNTSTSNRFLVEGDGAEVNFSMDVDSAAARAGLDGIAAHSIDFRTNRSEGFKFVGITAQEINAEAFDVLHANRNEFEGGTVTQTIGFNTNGDKVTVNSNDVRVSSVSDDSRTYVAELIVAGGEVNTSDDVDVGRTQDRSENTDNDTANSTGTLTIGDVTNAGTVTVGDDLRVGNVLQDSLVHSQVAVGTVTVNNAGSLLTVDGDLELAILTSAGAGATSTGTFTINDGNAVLNGNVTNRGGSSTINVNGGNAVLNGNVTDDGSGSSTMNVNGGRVNFANVGATKAVDTLNFGDGAGTDTMEFAISGTTTALATTDTTVAAGATIDVLTAGPDSFSDANTFDTWTAGVSNWDATGSNWDLLVTPNNGGAIAAGQEIDLITSTNIIGGSDAALDAGDAAAWSILNEDNRIAVKAINAIAGSTVVAAAINGVGSTVERTSDLNIQNSGGQLADAARLDLTDGAILNLTGAGTDLILGGAGAGGNVNQGLLADANATTVSIAGDLVYGNGGAGTNGGSYNLNSGTLTVTGDIVEGASGAPDADVTGANLNLNSSTVNALSVGGSITVQNLRVGNAEGSTVTQTFTDKTLVTTAELSVGTSVDGGALATGTLTLDGGTATVNTLNVGEDGAANGTLHIINGGVVNSNSRVYVGGDETNADDVLSIGLLNLNTGSSLTVAAGTSQIGRGGAGTFNVDAATFTQTTDNLQLGTGSAGSTAMMTVANGADINILAGSLDMDGGDGAGDGVNDNQLMIIGGTSTIDVSGDLLMDISSQLAFDFEGVIVNDFNFIVGGNAALGEAANESELMLSNIGALSTYSGDILLVNAASVTGAFSNVAEGNVFGAYRFTQGIGGVAGQIGLVAVPEPSFLALLGIGCIGLVGRRRRRV